MTAKEILKMIEEVDPSDTDKLDEIDIMVNLFVDCLQSVRETFHDDPTMFIKARKRHRDFPLYTRSRDALKAIRPEGYGCWIEIRTADDGDAACKIGRNTEAGRSVYIFGTNTIGYMRSEELAELHAIIQAIEYERGGIEYGREHN